MDGRFYRKDSLETVVLTGLGFGVQISVLEDGFSLHNKEGVRMVRSPTWEAETPKWRLPLLRLR